MTSILALKRHSIACDMALLGYYITQHVTNHDIPFIRAAHCIGQRARLYD